MIKEHQFVRLFVRHEAELRAFAMTLLPRPADADDAVQDACVAMWQRIGELEEEKAFRSWAYTFVRFTALNKARKLQRSPLVFREEVVDLLADEGERDAERAGDVLQALAVCLEKLPEGQKDLVRRYYQSATVRMADVAESLQRNVAGLYKALGRTREALRVCIEQRLSERTLGGMENRS
jgi:RNA polymerase sigma-70 factor (ECF subfamily)